MEAITIVVADGNSLFREGIKELLTSIPDFAVLGAVATETEALAEVERHQPDIMLLDVDTPDLDPHTLVDEAQQLSPATKIIVLATYENSSDFLDTLRCGATAFLTKTVTSEELVAALTTVMRSDGNVLLSLPQHALGLLEQLAPPVEPLSVREVDIVALIAQALSNRQVASRLHISEATVKRHLTNIYTKLGAVSRVDAVRRAHTIGLVDLASAERPDDGVSRRPPSPTGA